MKFQVMMIIIPLHFLVCILYPRQDLLPPLQRDRGPERESIWCKVTQQGKGRGRAWAHMVLCLVHGPSGRASGSPLAFYVLENLLAWEPEFLLAWASVSPPRDGCPSNFCLSTRVSYSECWLGSGWWDSLPILLSVVLKSRLDSSNIFTSLWQMNVGSICCAGQRGLGRESCKMKLGIVFLGWSEDYEIVGDQCWVLRMSFINIRLWLPLSEYVTLAGSPWVFQSFTHYLENGNNDMHITGKVLVKTEA